MLETFTVETFSGLVGDIFRLQVDGEQGFDTELIEATPLGPALDQARAPFSLVFRGPAGILVPQRIYRLDHADLGAFELFLVPIGPDEVGMRYQAVFS